jgi:hypothetical protein
MTTARNLLGSLVLLAGLSSCDTKDEKIPSYLYIEKFTFSSIPAQGSSHQNITDGWVYVNGQYYGAYELPVWIPVLEEGPSSILIFPGYRQDGRLTNAFQYALLKEYKTEVDLTARETDTIRPVTSYQNDLKFFLEEFEHIHCFTEDNDNDPDTKILISTPAEAFEGTGSGLIELTKAHPFLSAECTTPLEIPQSIDPIILELSFKSDIPFSIGFIGYKGFNEQVDLINAVVLPKQEWTKIYFDFREIIIRADADRYQLAIIASYNNDNTQPVQRILLDNIKVIYRQ